MPNCLSLVAVVLFLAMFQGSLSFKTITRLNLNKNYRSDPNISKIATPRQSSMAVQVLPQIAFAAASAGAVFWYVATHIDEIKEQQGRAVAAAQQEQSQNVKSAQESQRLALEKIRQQQEENARKARQTAEEAQRRANEATRR